MATTGEKGRRPSKFGAFIGVILIGGLMIAGVRNSILLAADDPFYPDLAAALFICGIVTIALTVLFGRGQLNKIGASAIANSGNIVLRPPRLRNIVSLFGFIAITPEFYFWAHDSAAATGYSAAKRQVLLWILFAGIVILDLVGCWLLLRFRSPILIDQLGIQFTDSWAGTLLWRDIKDVRPIQVGRVKKIAVELYEPAKIQLKRRSPLMASAHLDESKHLLILQGIGARIPMKDMITVMHSRLRKYGRRNGQDQ